MTTPAERKTLSRKSTVLRLVMASIVAAGLIAAGVGFLYFKAPVRGEACSVEHATTQDAIGHTLICDPKVDGTHELVWQYPSESNVEMQGDRSYRAP